MHETKRADAKTKVDCAACGAPVEFNYSIHRDGFCKGPEVWICDGCGANVTPTCRSLWKMIAERIAAGHTCTINDGSTPSAVPS